MTTDVEDILEAVRSLPPAKQLELLQSLARALGEAYSPLVADSADFWSRRSIDELAAEQGDPVASRLEDLVMPDWPADESPEDLNAYIRSQREADRGV